MNKENNTGKSMIMLIFSMLTFGTIGIFRRFIPLSSGMLACFRGLSGGLFLILIAKMQKRKILQPIGRKKYLLLILTGTLIGLNWILLFEAYNYTSVATATLCYYMEPTIVILASPLVFQEKLTLKKGVCALFAIIGMFFVSGMVENGIPQAGELKGILFGLGAASLYATVVILNKSLAGIDVYEKTILQLLSASIVLIPYLLFTENFLEVRLDTMQFIMLLLVGLVHTGIAYACYFGSIDGLRAQTVAIFSYIDPISALILSGLILQESLTIYGLIGAFMILGAAILGELTPSSAQ